MHTILMNFWLDSILQINFSTLQKAQTDSFLEPSEPEYNVTVESLTTVGLDWNEVDGHVDYYIIESGAIYTFPVG